MLCLKALYDLTQSILIDSVTLLQIDATIVAGAIILLTITSFVGRQGHQPIKIPFLRNHPFALTPHQVASGTIIGFGGSAFVLLISDSPRAQELAWLFAIIGFGWLIVSGIIIAAKEQFSKNEV